VRSGSEHGAKPRHFVENALSYFRFAHARQGDVASSRENNVNHIRIDIRRAFGQ